MNRRVEGPVSAGVERHGGYAAASRSWLISQANLVDGFEVATPFARLVAERLQDERFTLVDVGCSGGIHPVWRVFGDGLRAFGFDPNVEEVSRLSKAEDLPGVSYIPGFVGLPPENPDTIRFPTRDFWTRNPWDRLSVVSTLERRAAQLAEASLKDKTEHNIWPQVVLSDPKKPVILPRFLSDHGVTDVDFIKIDIDGADFLILRSLKSVLDDANVVGVGIEVNFFGSEDPNANTFHNVDRFMKSCGFELFSLSTRHYSVAALPAPYLSRVPAQGAWGRPLQGDAIYFRDAAAKEMLSWSSLASPGKLAKLAALFSLAGLPDCAAEVLLQFRPAIGTVIDIGGGLDCLLAQCPTAKRPSHYNEYIAEFEADSDHFYAASDLDTQHSGSSEDRELRAEIVRLGSELANVKNSTSWRMTGPFRAVVTALRRAVPVFSR
jgi:hypothetical protein